MSMKLTVPNFPGKNKLVAKTSRLAVKMGKHSPEILVAAGIVGFVGTAVLAATATLKVEDILDAHQEKMDKIKTVEADPDIENYTAEDATKDRAILTLKTIGHLTKLYAPAICLGMISAACVIGGHHILLKRNLGLAAAYTAVQTAFDDYRKRVAEECGEDKEKELYLGVREKIEEIEKNGKIKKVSQGKEITDKAYPYSPYARIFDETSRWYKKNAELNKLFLTSQQNHANDLLHLQGHLFLNEVFDMLDLPRTPMGAVVGWVYGNGDSFVDFGIFDSSKPGCREFINGLERAIWLDFNVDGVIYDMI